MLAAAVVVDAANEEGCPAAAKLALAAAPRGPRVASGPALVITRPSSSGSEDGAAYTARVLDELVGGLEIRVDGEPVALERGETPSPSGVGDRRFITFRVQLEGTLAPGARTLHVIGGISFAH